MGAVGLCSRIGRLFDPVCCAETRNILFQLAEAFNLSIGKDASSCEVAEALRRALMPRVRLNPRVYNAVQIGEVLDSFMKQYGSSYYTSMVDGKYRVLTWQEMNDIIRHGWVGHQKYIREFYDCDDFALYFKAFLSVHYRVNGVGIILDYTGGHAYNIVFLHRDGDLYTRIYDPTLGRWVQEKELGEGMYKLKVVHVYL